ncbi:MAG: TetR/AcrR family transcriptional regulator [Acidimicrobiales bacterium]
MSIDGRTARALRTREAIVDASIALVDEGDLRPTAPRIAERAGVSVRSVFQHFDDLEGLYAAVADRFMDRLGDRTITVDPAAPLTTRLPEVVRQRVLQLQAVTPIRQAAAIHAPFSSEVRKRLSAGHAHMRLEIERVFTQELAGLSAGDRRTLLDALDTVLTWPTWDSLRTLNGRSEAEASAVLTIMVRALLPH